jgi:hypothetical protein
MKRYFFHLYECGTQVVDEEGVELPDHASVHDRAMRAAREIMASELMNGQLCLSCRIEVLDEEQRPVLILPFKEAVAITGA